MAGTQRAASELGPAAAGWGGGLAAGLAALLVSAALLAVWLELATLQWEVHTLRGRLQVLENTCLLRAQLGALSQAVRYEERIIYRSGNEEVIVSFPEDETPTPTNEAVKINTPARMNDYNRDRDGHTGNGRHRRETVSGTWNPNLPDLQESGNSPRNPTDREKTSDDRNLHMLLSRDVSLTPPANHTTSAVILPDSASIAPLRKNNRARNRKKHTHRSETAVASATGSQPDPTEAAATTRHSRVAGSDSGLMRSMGKSSALRSQPTREDSSQATEERSEKGRC
ncbi:uncharacterized protein LOC134529675 isoform X2 [Bacillus rossius redtenbacheri]|uniref:uncharacterized protein LOC134529675 isoform X2 n=1 Tax=Bacillus rossius redtenbacheri TaxID=93214 RepID=UPI002FDE0FAC